MLNQKDIDMVLKEISEMSKEELIAELNEIACDELRWQLEYILNPSMIMLDQYKLCMRYMWE